MVLLIVIKKTPAHTSNILLSFKVRSNIMYIVRVSVCIYTVAAIQQEGKYIYTHFINIIRLMMEIHIYRDVETCNLNIKNEAVLTNTQR